MELVCDDRVDRDDRVFCYLSFHPRWRFFAQVAVLQGDCNMHFSHRCILNRHVVLKQT